MVIAHLYFILLCGQFSLKKMPRKWLLRAYLINIYVRGKKK